MQLLTDNTFDKNALTGGLPALVLFIKDWSGHSQIMAMILDRLQTLYSGEVCFFRVDCEQSHNLAQRFAIGRIPTILIFKDGNPVDRIAGIISESDLTDRIRGVIESLQDKQTPASLHRDH